tara:strand:- start:311 stop:631 length:321 start_codon:yes stop_codon:yes gene_type:complete
MENEITYFEYWKEVRELADSIVSKEDYSDDTDIHDILWERIDSHNWISYNYKAYQVMGLTDNPDAFLDMGMGVPDGSWWDVVTQFAHCAFRADVEQAVSRIDMEVK